MHRAFARLVVVVVTALTGVLLGLSSVLAQAENAALRIVHAVPDGPAVDVYLDGERVAEGLTFFSVGNYLPVPPGEHLVQVTSPGTPPGSGVINTTFTFEPGQAYTLAASGLNDAILATLLEDERSIPTAGDTKIRFIHLVPGGPAVDIRRVGQDVPLVNNLAFQEASDYLPLLPGRYAFNVVAVGQNEPLVDLSEFVLADEPIYDIFLVGTPGAIRAELAIPAAQGAVAQPTPQTAATAAPTSAAQATAAPTSAAQATAAPTSAAQATAAPTSAAQATAAPTSAVQATAAPTSAAPTEGQGPSQLPETAGQAAAPLWLVVAAALLLGAGALIWHRGSAGR